MSPANALARRLAKQAWSLREEVKRASLVEAVALLELAFAESFGRRARWVRYLARKVIRLMRKGPVSARGIENFIGAERVFRAAARELFPPSAAAAMCPAPGAPERWDPRKVTTLPMLAEWLNVSLEELQWFADGRALERGAPEKMQHYHRRWVRKRDGSFRLIETPKQRMKGMQRAILREILDRIPAHEAAHGFRKGRSIATFSGTHVGKAIVLKIDLRDFFPAFSLARVFSAFSSAGYPDVVAKSLAGLCTTICSRGAIAQIPKGERRRARLLYLRQHLPQGAPTSPALANICAFHLDCRLAGLARAAGGTYTRYADDLLFSGDDEFARRIQRFLIHALAVIIEEGFQPHPRKVKVMRKSVAQQAAGLVLNTKLNTRRAEFDQLKATLTNCARRGFAAENRSNVPDFPAHLRGRISHIAMINPARGEKLRRLFERIPAAQ